MKTESSSSGFDSRYGSLQTTPVYIGRALRGSWKLKISILYLYPSIRKRKFNKKEYSTLSKKNPKIISLVKRMEPCYSTDRL